MGQYALLVEAGLIAANAACELWKQEHLTLGAAARYFAHSSAGSGPAGTGDHLLLAFLVRLPALGLLGQHLLGIDGLLQKL